MLYFGSLSVFSLAGSWFIKYCGIWNQPCFVIRRKTGLRWIKHTYNDAINIYIVHVSGPRILTITQSPTSRCLQRQLQRQRQKQPPLWPVWLAPPQPQRQSALVLKHIYIYSTRLYPKHWKMELVGNVLQSKIACCQYFGAGETEGKGSEIQIGH